MTEEYLNTKMSMFYQRDPDGTMTYLDKVALSDFRLSGREAGDPYDRPDPGDRGGFKIQDYLPGGLINPGFSCQRPYMEINYLWDMAQEGKINFRMNSAFTGVENDVENYGSALVFVQGDVVSPGLDGGKALQSGDAAVNLTTMEAQAREGFELLPLANASRLTTTADQQGTGIYSLHRIKAGTLRRRIGEHVVATVQSEGAGTAAYAYRSIDYGVAWTASSTSVFNGGENPAFPLEVDLPQTNQERYILFCNTTAAGTAARCEYTDATPSATAWGASWTSVDIGSSSGQYVTASFRVHDGLILAGTDDGNVYYSKDKGVSWTVGSYGGSNDINGFALAPNGTLWAGGNSSEVYYSEDDGVTWTAVTTSPSGDVLDIAVNYNGYVFIIDGTALKYSRDEGLSWTTVTVASDATSLVRLEFDPDYAYIGSIIVVDAGSDDRLYRSEDGGITWIAQTTSTTNTGYNELFMASANLVYVVGDVVATTFKEKVFGKGKGS